MSYVLLCNCEGVRDIVFTATLTMYKQYKLETVWEVRRCEVDITRLNIPLPADMLKLYIVISFVDGQEIYFYLVGNQCDKFGGIINCR